MCTVLCYARSAAHLCIANTSPEASFLEPNTATAVQARPLIPLCLAHLTEGGSSWVGCTYIIFGNNTSLGNDRGATNAVLHHRCTVLCCVCSQHIGYYLA
jgi:hypothetical protein